MSEKGQLINVFGFVGHRACVATAQLCLRSLKEGTEGAWLRSSKTSFSKEEAGWVWPGQWSLSILGAEI